MALFPNIKKEVDNMSDERVNTPVELEFYKLQTKLAVIKLIMRYVILILSMATGLTIGLIFNGEYATYSFLLILSIVSYELGTNGGGIKELMEKLINKS